MIKRVPNIISLVRILLVPVIVWLVVIGDLTSAFWVFVAAGVSDAVDGYIAKSFDAVTEVGTYLDPVADKVLLVSVFVALGTMDYLPAWLVIVVVSRDALIVGGVLFSFALSLPTRAHPSVLGKINTGTQMGFAAVVLAVHGMAWPLDLVASLGAFFVGGLAALSGGQYVWRWSLVAFHDGSGD
jgi:cardiolipin synthase